MAKEPRWDIVILPKSSFWSYSWGELWRYRELCGLFVRRNITTHYIQTLLGPLWYVVQPLMIALMYTLVFGYIAKLSTDGIPQPLFYLCGICFWQYFSDTLHQISTTFINNAYLFGKVYFPRVIIPISTAFSNLIRLGFQFGVFVLVYLFYGCFTDVAVMPNIYCLLLPLLILLLLGISLGIGVFVAAFTTKYRDMHFFLAFFLNLWMFGTPIIYPLSMVSNPTLRLLMQLNPLTGIIEFAKYGLLSQGCHEWWMLLYSGVFAMVILYFSFLIFNQAQKACVDTI